MRRSSRCVLLAAMLALQARGQVPGTAPRIAPPDPCADIQSRPLVTLTLEPAEIFPDDRVTLRWEVRDKRPGVAWPHPVHVHRTFRVGDVIPDPAPAQGTASWVAPRSILSGTFSVSTLCGQKTVDYVLEQTPRIDRVTPERGTLGQSVSIHGDHFGVRHVPKPPSEVRFTLGAGTFRLDVKSWTNQRIDATLPSLPAGEGTLRVHKAARLVSLPVPFRSLPYPEIDVHPAGSLPTPSPFPSSVRPPPVRPGM